MSEHAAIASHRLPAALAAVLLCAGTPGASAQAANENAQVPDFSSGNAGWVTIGVEWTAVPGGPQPVGCDPAHPCVGNNTGKQPTFKVADTNNPT